MSLTVRVLHPVASGGQARVLAGVLESQLPDGSLGRHPVAVKRPHTLDATAQARFVREATLATTLSSAHVVPVLGVAEVDGLPALVMPWIEGTDLQALLRSEPLAPRVAVRVVLDCAAGLAELHERGIAHRDVSPDNVRVGVDGVSRIADFGLIRAHEHESRSLAGKAAYVSPESIRGEPVDARADVFVLAAILVEAVVGRPWFRGASDAETLERVLHRPAPDGLEGADLLIPLLTRALDKSPSERPADARTFADELFFEARTAGLLGASEEVRECVLARTSSSLQRERARRAEAIAALQPARETAPTPRARVLPAVLLASMLAATIGAVGGRLLWPAPVRAHAEPITAAVPTRSALDVPAPAPTPDALDAQRGPAASAPAARPTRSADPKPSTRSAAPNPYRTP